MSVESMEGRSGRSVFKLFIQLLFPMNLPTLRPKGKINYIVEDSDFPRAFININMDRSVLFTSRSDFALNVGLLNWWYVYWGAFYKKKAVPGLQWFSTLNLDLITVIAKNKGKTKVRKFSTFVWSRNGIPALKAFKAQLLAKDKISRRYTPNYYVPTKTYVLLKSRMIREEFLRQTKITENGTSEFYWH